MKKLFLLGAMVCALGMMIGCKSESAEDKLNKSIDSLNTMLNEALNSQETILDVPMDFVLNCTEQEYKNHLAMLIAKYGGEDENVKYDFLGMGEQLVWVRNFPYFSDPNTMTDTICEVDFGIKEHTDELEKTLDSILGNEYESVVVDVDNHYRRFWRKDNMIVYLHKSWMMPHVHIKFCNMPKRGNTGLDFLKDIQDDLNRKIQWDLKKEQQKKEKKVKVENSPWDGSVYQAKKYIKSSLKDPSSYESIEWSPVQKTTDGYMVRHKFRAKNSFGGYVIEEYVITLNERGEVIEAVKTE